MSASKTSRSKAGALFWQTVEVLHTEQAGEKVPYELLEGTTPPAPRPTPVKPGVDALTGLALAQAKAQGDLTTALAATTKSTPVTPERPDRPSADPNPQIPAPNKREGNPLLPALATEQAKARAPQESTPAKQLSVASTEESTPTAPENWDSVLESWHQLLQQWAQAGSLAAAAQEAFNLDGPNAKPQSQGLLQSYISEWSAGNFENLPEIAFLSAEDMRGAFGAYAISTGKVYINADWAQNANPDAIHAVLTEEQGHHLDGVLNEVDTPGDEGEHFRRLMLGEILSINLITQIKQERDNGYISNNDATIAAELATTAVIRGNSLYRVFGANSWTQAEADSVALGGHLVTFNDAEERRWLSLNVYGNPIHIDRLKNGTQVVSDLNGYWVGLNDTKLNGSFEWISGQTGQWSKPEEYIVADNISRRLYLEANYEYTQVHSNSDGTTANILFDRGDTSEVYTAMGVDHQGIAEIPLTLNIVRAGTPTEGAGSFITRLKINAGTTTSGNLAEGVFVYWKVTGITADDLQTGSAGLTGFGQIKNGQLEIAHSLRIDSDTGEQFQISVYSDASMTQYIGSSLSSQVAEQSKTIRGSSLYTFTNGSTWLQAENNAKALGGHLITINDLSENSFINEYLLQNQFSCLYGGSSIRTQLNTREDLWIGLYYDSSIGRWMWSSGETNTFTNWKSNEPNSGGSYPNWAEINIGYDSRVPNWESGKGLWNDEITPWHKPLNGDDSDRFQFGITEIPLKLSINLPLNLKEGTGVFTTTINLTAGTETSGNLAEGSNVYWRITGIDSSDLSSGSLEGTGIITNGVLDIQHALANDPTVETENFSVTVYSDSARQYQIGATATGPIQDSSSINLGKATFRINGNDLSVSSQTLTCTLDQADPDGMTRFAPPSPTGYIYQWQSSADGISWSNISGATSFKYAANLSTDNGKFLQVSVTYTDDKGVLTTVNTNQCKVISGTTRNDKFTGTSGVEVTFAGSGADAVATGLGNDFAKGGVGNDTFNGGDNDGNDFFDGETEVDTLNYSASTKGVIIDMITGFAAERTPGGTGRDAFINIENARGTGAADIFTGNSASNTFTGGASGDTFRFAAALSAIDNVDTITDFSITQGDRIELENTGPGLFNALTSTGTLAAGTFTTGTSFTNASQRIRYDGSTGNLFYDADGNGSIASILFAKVSTGLAMTNNHFVVI